MKKYTETEPNLRLFEHLGISAVIYGPNGHAVASNWVASPSFEPLPATVDALIEALAHGSLETTAFRNYIDTRRSQPFSCGFIQKTNDGHSQEYILKAAHIPWREDTALIVQLVPIREIDETDACHSAGASTSRHTDHVALPDRSSRQEHTTEKTLMTDEMERLERLASIGQMASGIAHEFNNIITSILGWTQLALNATPLDSEAHSPLHIIEKNTRRAHRIAAELLDVANPTTQEITTPIDLADIAEEALRLVGWELSKAQIQVTRTIEPVRLCMGNATRLIQVFVNTIKNAIDATPKGGQIRVSVTERRGQVTASIADSGPGIPPHLRQRVFEPFFTTRKHSDALGGNGLGLAICKKIIEDYDGHIEVTDSEDGGALVYITLPGLEPSDEISIPPASTSSLPPGISVLVVDDEPDIGDMIKMALSLRGAHVTTVTSGECAIDRCKQEQYNAVFLDYGMTGISGHSLGRALQSIQPDIHIIYISGAQIPLDTSIDAQFLKKPFELQDIQSSLCKALG